MRQRGPSERLKQTSQSPTFSFTSRIASARANASSSLARRMWKASRCAVRCPIPGSFESSAIRRLIGPAYMRASVLSGLAERVRDRSAGHARRRAEARQAAAHAPGDAAQLALRPAPGPRGVASLTAAVTMSWSSSGSSGSIASGEIVISLQLHVAAHRHLDHAAAGARLDGLVLELLLGLRHLGLHLLDLLHQLAHVRSLRHQPVPLSRVSVVVDDLAGRRTLP